MKVLFLSPHTDDAELGCGGTIARFIEEGAEIANLAFTKAGNLDIVEEEMRKSMECLGIKEHKLFDIELRHFPMQRHKILQILYDYNKNNRIDMVFVPSTLDTHQDHQVITKEAMRAFKTSTILGFELPWNNIRFTTNYFVPLKDIHVAKKIEAIKCYKSQVEKYYITDDFIRGMLRVRGTQIQTKFAEAFEVIKVIHHSH